MSMSNQLEMFDKCGSHSTVKTQPPPQVTKKQEMFVGGGSGYGCSAENQMCSQDHTEKPQEMFVGGGSDCKDENQMCSGVPHEGFVSGGSRKMRSRRGGNKTMKSRRGGRKMRSRRGGRKMRTRRGGKVMRTRSRSLSGGRRRRRNNNNNKSRRRRSRRRSRRKSRKTRRRRRRRGGAEQVPDTEASHKHNHNNVATGAPVVPAEGAGGNVAEAGMGTEAGNRNAGAGGNGPERFTQYRNRLQGGSTLETIRCNTDPGVARPADCPPQEQFKVGGSASMKPPCQFRPTDPDCKI